MHIHKRLRDHLQRRGRTILRTKSQGRPEQHDSQDNSCTRGLTEVLVACARGQKEETSPRPSVEGDRIHKPPPLT